MVAFILAVNLSATGKQGKVSYNKAQQESKESVSSMTFDELGITQESVKEFLDSDKPSARFFKYSIALGFLIFILSLIFNLIFIFTGKRVDFTRSAHKQAVPWGIPDLIRVSIIILFLSYAIGLADGFIVKYFNIKLNLDLRMMINTLFIDIAAAWIIFYFVIVKYRKDLSSLGLKLSNFLSNVLTGITAYMLIIPLLLVVLILSVWFLNLIGYTPPPQPIFEIFMKEERSKVLLFLTIFVSIFGPVIEELFFRGFMYSAVRKRIGVTASAFLTGAVFSLLHTNVAGFLPIMTLGILLAYLYETTDSLVASMTVHILHNSIIVGFVFFIKQLL